MTPSADPLSSKVLLLAALNDGPSRERVADWLDRWPSLDDEFGPGHAVGLESSMFHAVVSGGDEGFRAAWVLALLSKGKILRKAGSESLFMEALDRTEDPGIQRELIRGLLEMDLSPTALRELFGWAAAVVYVEGAPTAHLHQGLLIMLRCLNELSPSDSDRLEMHEAASFLCRGSFSDAVKKKAALLRARLSGS